MTRRIPLRQVLGLMDVTFEADGEGDTRSVRRRQAGDIVRRAGRRR